MTVEAHRETMGFQTEVAQLLKLMIHSLYSNKEIFLRELVSNASDAADKLRFEALGDDALFEGDGDLRVEVGFDKEARTLTVRDNGIGMSRQEVLENLGTIARSGTRQFIERLSGDQAADSRLIGQFGVGFYSSFIVAERVEVFTRRAGLTAEHGVHWTSTGEGEFTIETVERAGRGTEVVLHLREGEDEFLDGWRIRSVIRKYSDHIQIPIRMPVEKTGDKDAADGGDDGWETVNQASALWARAKNDVTDEQYKEFYKHVAHDFEDPMSWLHAKVEGTKEYIQLLYLPARAPFDLWDRDKRQGVKLYVRRVFIMDAAEALMPAYLRFVRGVIDAADLPLNISREILQHNKDIDAIRAGSVKKVLGMLEDMARNDAEKYASFWKHFGMVLKEGVGEDHANRERIAGLLRFASTHNDDDAQTVSLDDYIGRMKDGQEKIYYITAESHAAARNSPHLEVFRKKGVEVLLLSDRVDEWLTFNLHDYKDKQLHSAAKGQLDLKELGGEEEQKQQEEEAKEMAGFTERVKNVLDERVKDVRVSHRLTESPSCLVVEEQDIAPHLQQMLKAAGHSAPGIRPTLEVNAHHPLVARMQGEADEERFRDWSELLFEQARLAEGTQLDDPASYVKRVNRLILELGG